MSMSRKDYEAAAEVIANAMKYADEKTPVRRTETVNTLREMASGLSSMFGRDNGRFDRDKFMTACGLGTVPTSTAKIDKNDTLYLYGARVKVIAVVDRKTVKVLDMRPYGLTDPYEVAVSTLNY